jgi:(5-formylfuran-3-yl)methyl phosphate synthase
MARQYALSVKQPWAALLVCGRKTIEVRSWRTRRRGRVLIHAARIPDERPGVWDQVPTDLLAAARQYGGLVGAADLVNCLPYHSLEAFRADQPRHLNEPSWFRPARLYGFTFANAVALPFHRCPGQTRFFTVDYPPVATGGSPVAPAEKATGGPPIAVKLLVSVRSAAEAEAALAGGAALIDVKEPSRGPLGRADDETIAQVLWAVAGRAPVSAALGEWREPGAQSWPGVLGDLAYLKWGLSGCGGMVAWQDTLRVVARYLAGRHPDLGVAAVAYADWRQARAPSPEEVCAWACAQGRGAFLLDTWGKDGRTLLDWVSVAEVSAWCTRCRAAGVRVALAGSLGPEQVGALLPAGPDWFAVRGAACEGGRAGTISTGRVHSLVQMLVRR